MRYIFKYRKTNCNIGLFYFYYACNVSRISYAKKLPEKFEKFAIENLYKIFIQVSFAVYIDVLLIIITNGT